VSIVAAHPEESTMARTRRSLAQARARRSTPHFAFGGNGDGDATWLEWGGSELRLHDDGGGVIESIALPDAHTALGRLEFARGELDTLAEEIAEEGGHWT
jgi:hypothetical protein